MAVHCLGFFALSGVALAAPVERTLEVNRNEVRVALVVGNSAYPAGSLENPRHDAAAMERTLKRLGFDTEILIDASKAQLDAAMRRLGNRAARADVAALFYAGHGIQVNGINYIVPVDARPQT